MVCMYDIVVVWFSAWYILWLQGIPLKAYMYMNYDLYAHDPLPIYVWPVTYMHMTCYFLLTFLVSFQSLDRWLSHTLLRHLQLSADLYNKQPIALFGHGQLSLSITKSDKTLTDQLLQPELVRRLNRQHILYSLSPTTQSAHRHPAPAVS